LEASLPALAIALAVTVLAAGVQSTVGIGFAVISVPLLGLLDSDLAPVPQLLVTLPLTLAMVGRERYAIDLSGVGWIIVGRIPGLIIGLVLLKIVSDRALDLVIGLIVLGAVLILSTGASLKRNPVTQVTTGTVSGVTGLVASIGGPPLALLYRDAKGAMLRSSLAAVFTIGITLSIAGRWVTDEIDRSDVAVALLLFPALVVGFFLGSRYRTRLEGRPLRIAILVISALAAIGLIVKSLVRV
jgi:uncharacterized membrane protein YfcA